MPIDHQNFRLRGIPCEYQSRADVRELVKTILSITSGTSFAVHSLTTSPVEHSSKVATLSFHTLPDDLSDNSRDEWVFSLPVDDHRDCITSRRFLVFDTHFSGFTPLQHAKDEDCHVDVIAISGLGGHAFGSFKERQGPFMWLRDALPLDVPRARVLIYGYDTHLIQSSSFQNLTDLGRTLQIDMKGMRRSNQSRSIIFIGHSLGGLVIKEAIVKMTEAKDEEDVSMLNSVSGFLFFGVPHLGMAIESLVPLVRDNPNRGLLESLNKNSALLQRLEKEFSNAFGIKCPRVIAFFETECSPTAEEKGDKWMLSGPPKVLVDVSSATCGSKNQHPINRTHSDMVKCKHHYDDLYTRIRTALQPLVSRQGGLVVRAMDNGTSVLPLLSGKHKECLKSLAFREQESRYHDIHSAENTCRWLFEDLQYQAWLNQPRGLFWIKGHPGAGKSVLMKFAVKTMSCRKSDQLIASFFCHGRGTTLQKTPLGAFRALLHSVLTHFPECLSLLTAKFEDREARFGSYEMDRWEWAEKELREFISEVLIKSTKNQPVAIFIDALDECGKDNATDLIGYFRKLMNDVKREGGQVKICFSSRHYPILGVHKIPTIFVEEQNGKDIRLFIQERLEDIKPRAKREMIEKEILLKAHGGFQWAVLVAAIVIQRNETGINADNLYKGVADIPETLEELYGNILSDVANVESTEMIKLFQWVLFAERPLSAQELREALATDKEMTCSTISELRSSDSWVDSSAHFEIYVQQISRGLVEFQTRDLWEQYEPDERGWDREAQFIHQSVADYVLNIFPNYIGHFQSISSSPLGAGNFQISRSCLRYITLSEVLEATQLPRSTLSARFPLAPYAVRFLFHHIRVVEREGIPQSDLLSLIKWEQQSKYLPKIGSLWSVLDPGNAHTPMGWPFQQATPLHILIALGSMSACDVLIQKSNVEVDGCDAEGNTPLLLAIRERHWNLARILLSRSIRWQRQRMMIVDQPCTQHEEMEQRKNHFVDVNAENKDGDTPLTIAVRENAEDVVFQLIEAGADLKLYEQETRLLMYAVCNRNKGLLMKLIERGVKLDGTIYLALKQHSSGNCDDVLEGLVAELLNAGANTSKLPKVWSDIEEEDELGDEAILLASRYGQASMVKLLLERSTVVDPRDGSGRTPLLVAAQDGHEAVVKLLLEKGVNTEARDNKYARTPLLWAMRNGHGAVVKLLLEKGVDIEAKDKSGRTPLLVAVQDGHEAVVKLLLEKGVDIEAKDKSGRTPLLVAVQDGHEAVVKLLLEKGVNIEAKDKSGRTPLLVAVQDRHEAVVKLLLEKGVNTEARDNKYARTPLLWAMQDGHEAVVWLLLEKGVDIEAKDESGRTPLLVAVQVGHEAVVKLLLEKGVNTEARENEYARTPLLWAMRNRHGAVAKLLLEKGVDIEAKDESGRTPLLVAAQDGHETVVKLLLEKGVNKEARDNKYARTPLIWAVQNRHEVVVKLLLEKGVNIEAKDKTGRTPLLFAVQDGHEAVVKLLLEKSVNTEARDNKYARTPLIWAVQNRHEVVVKLLLEKGVNIEAKDKTGRAPLLAAVQDGQKELVQLLLEKGVNKEARDNEYSRTPLSWAIQNRHEAVVMLLLEKSVNIEAKDDSGRTPLLFAAQGGHKAVTKLLLEKSINTEARDNNYARTALLWAVRNGHGPVVKLLLENGVNIEAKDNSGRTPLLVAAQDGHKEVVKLLLQKAVNIEARDNEYARTSLSWAARHRHQAVVKLLLEKGADIEAKDNSSRTPLLVAVQVGHEAVAKLLLEKGVDIEAKDKSSRTPLLVAVQVGYEAVVKLLLEKGVNKEARDNSGRTPLLVAVQDGHEAVAKLLLENGVDIEAKDNEYDRTALLWAMQDGHEALVWLLLETGVDIETKDINGWTPLLVAARNGHEAVANLLLRKGGNTKARDNKYARTPLLWAMRNRHEAVVRLLLKKGVNIEAKDERGRTPLLFAAQDGHEAVVKLLLEKGVNIEARDSEYARTPLSWAARNRHEEVVKLLLEKGADIETKDTNGWTPLLFASQSGQAFVLKLLLKKGVNIEAKNVNGWTALLLAAWSGHKAVAKLLLKYDANTQVKDVDGWTPLLFAARNGHDTIVKLLLEKGVDIEAKESKHCCTAILFATRNRHELVVRLLLGKGANAQVEDIYGWTPLSFAAWNGHKAVVKLLLENGVDIEPKDVYGWTPLFFAARNGHKAVTKQLLKRGVNILCKDESGRTPLLLAAQNGHEEVVKLLLDKGVDGESKDNSGRTPVLLAARNGHEAVVKLLLERE